MTRNLSIWNDLRPFTIGFDDLFNQFDHYVDNRSKHLTIQYRERQRRSQLKQLKWHALLTIIKRY